MTRASVRATDSAPAYRENRINHLNSALMAVACLAAVALPFEVFLVAYAVLGPAHYLTEISWLRDRRYFTSGRWDSSVLAAAAVGLAGLYAVGYLLDWRGAASWGGVLICVTFASALAMVALERPAARIGLVATVALAAVALRGVEAYWVVFAIFLPTIIHVAGFTLLFVLLGALRSRSRSGFASLIVYAACCATCFMWPSSGGQVPEAGSFVRETYLAFADLNIYLMRLLYPGHALSGMEDSFAPGPALAVMRFIAFAYTYHYLNWFSKTTVIRWHEMSRRKALFLGILWILSVGAYATDYRWGLAALFVLSTLHVFLEFPLDFRTFAGAGRELTNLLGPARSAHASGS